MKRVPVFLPIAAILWMLSFGAVGCSSDRSAPGVYRSEEGFADAGGVMIYFKTVGKGDPLIILHGGPGASHDYFLPYLLPLARKNRIVFIDERGSGRSQKLEDPSGYTVDNMVGDVEAVRLALGLKKINLLGHSFGGVLAQAYALRYPRSLSRLILCSTFHSTAKMNLVFQKMRDRMKPELRRRIENMEKNGVFGHGRDWEKIRYTQEYMTAAWGEGYFPYLYRNRPDPNFDPGAMGNMAWDVYREMWGSDGEFAITGNLGPIDFSERLASIRVPTLITVGDNDECAPWLSEEMHQRIPGSRLVVLPRSGHMTFVDQPALFLKTVEEFLQAD
jgi:proline iminopeptidase